MSDKWYTPAWVFESLGLQFDVDVCAPVGGTGIVPASKHYSIEDDGLTQDWQGLVWMNPPYSKPTPWIDKWLEHRNGLTVVPFAKSKWFQKLWNEADGIVAMPPNIKFVQPDGSLKQIFMNCLIASVGIEATNALKQSGMGIVR